MTRSEEIRLFPRESNNTWVLQLLCHYLPGIRPRDIDMTSLSFRILLCQNQKGEIITIHVILNTRHFVMHVAVFLKDFKDFAE